MKFISFLLIGIFLSLYSNPALAVINLATVGKKQITDNDLKSKIGELPPVQKNFLKKNEAARARLVENLVVEELFAQEALKMGLNKRPDFKKALENRRAELLARAYIKEKIDKEVNDKNIRNYFNKNKIRYRTDEVQAYHILLKTRAEAQEVRGKAVKASNDDFKTLAKKYSKDPSAARNLGDLGYFTRARMVPEFSEVAFKMKKGQTSQPVKTAFGWHIIRVVDKKKGKNPTFNSSTMATVKNHLRDDLLKKLRDKLKKQNKVNIYEANIKKLRF